MLALAGGILVARPTWAEPPAANVLAIGELPERVYDALGVRSDRVATLAALQRQRQRQRALSALARLNEVDAALTLARRATVALEEDKALRTLSRAEQLLRETLELPGAAAHYAELQLQLGVSAAHGGQAELADAAFARAASVDPGRQLLAGEASPEVVSLARRAFERVANAREGVLHIHTNVAAARVFVDDVDLGSTPLSARIRGGVHVLRVEAEDHTAYARLFDMLEGDRPALEIVLSREPLADVLQRLNAARSSASEIDAARASASEMDGARVSASEMDGARVSASENDALGASASEMDGARVSASEIDAARAQLFELEPTLELLLLGERAGDRGWFARCDRAACTIATYPSSSGEPLQVSRAEQLSSSTLRAARAWLTPFVVATQPIAAPLWQQWYVWAAAGAIVVSAGLWAGIAAQPDPQHRLRVSVDSSALR